MMSLTGRGLSQPGPSTTNEVALTQCINRRREGVEAKQLVCIQVVREAPASAITILGDETSEKYALAAARQNPERERRRTASVRWDPSDETASDCNCWAYESAMACIRPEESAHTVLSSIWTTRSKARGHTHAVVRRSRIVTSEQCDLRHRLDTDDALDREVGLVREAARKVVRAELTLGDERFGDEELRPLVEELELCVIVGISGHDENTGVGRSRRS